MMVAAYWFYGVSFLAPLGSSIKKLKCPFDFLLNVNIPILLCYLQVNVVAVTETPVLPVNEGSADCIALL